MTAKATIVSIASKQQGAENFGCTGTAAQVKSSQMRRQFVADQRRTVGRQASPRHDPEDNPGSGTSAAKFITSQNGQLKHRIQSVFLCVTKSDRGAQHSKTNRVFCTYNKHEFFNICNYLGCLRVILIHAYKPS